MAALRLHAAATAAVIAVTSASPASAQRLGFTVGATQSDVVTGFDGGATSYPDRGSLTVGATYRHRLASGVVLQPELLLVQRGWSSDSRPTLSLSYLEAPLLLRFGALSPRGAWLRPVLTVGAAASLLLRCDLAVGLGAVQTAGRGCGQRIVQPFVEDYRVGRFDAGLLAGLGLEGRLPGGTVIGLEGRYEYGLTDIRPGSAGTSRNGTFFVLLNVVPHQTGDVRRE